jgi:hypothetical protein
MSQRNVTVIVLALVLMVGGFLGVLFVGQIVNPAPASVAVALVDIPAGTTLTQEMFALDSVHADEKVIAGLIGEDELGVFVGGTVIEPIHAFQPIPKAALSAEGNPAATTRSALGLSDPGLVAMVVPVTPDTAPDAIVEGDYVDLNFGVGMATQSGGRLTTAPTPEPFAAYAGLSDPTLIPEGTAAATATPEPLLMLPVAKTIVSHARVLAVIREERTTTVQNEGDPAPRTVVVKGKAIALVVAVAREAQELLGFAIDNGTVRVSLLSAEASLDEGGERRPTLGMTWNDLVALVRMERDGALAAGLPTQVIGPGAFAVEATRAAATQTAMTLTPLSAEVVPSHASATPEAASVTATPTRKP